MTKNAGIVTLICLVLAVAVLGGFFYWHRPHRFAHQPVSSGQPRDSIAPLPPTRANPAPGSRTPTAGGTSSEKGLPAKAGTVAAPGFVPRSGESLEFAANVAKLNSTIANLRIATAPKQTLDGKNVWHFQAFAHTENPYRMIFELDDQFDSYSDVSGMTSLQYEMHLSERGQKVDSVQRMLPSLQDAAPPKATAARVLPGTRDPLGMLQYLRGVDWNKSPETRSPVYDGRKLYDVHATLVSKSAAVSVPAGSFNTSKIELRVFDNGTEMKDAHFFLYLTNDSAHTPVLLEAVLPIATARVELTRAS